MRLVAVGSALLFILSAVDVGAIAGQTPDALTLQSLRSSHPTDGGSWVNGDSGSPLHARLLTALAGGAVGAGLGFFASQVFTSDWEKNPSDDGVDRRPWAAVGGSIGFAVGFSFPLSGRRERPESVRSAPAGQPVITVQEVRSTGVNTAYQAVQLLRPEWLNPRGFHTFGEDTDPDERILVYLDNVQLGGVESMREVSVNIIRSIYFLDAAASTYRWGAGHSHGAILLLTDDSSEQVRVRE